jgi:transposase-like protein
MIHQNRNRYDEDFKKRAVLHHQENHATLAESAEQFGITAGMLSKWVEQYSSKVDDQSMDCQAEIRQLKGEMKSLREIVAKAFLQKFTDDEIAERMIDEPEKFLKADEVSSKEQ